MYTAGCGDHHCILNCENCKYNEWKVLPTVFRHEHVSKYGKTIFLTKREAEFQCERNKALNEARHKSNL